MKREVGRFDVCHRKPDLFLDQVAVAAQVFELCGQPIVGLLERCQRGSHSKHRG